MNNIVPDNTQSCTMRGLLVTSKTVRAAEQTMRGLLVTSKTVRAAEQSKR